jgi:hypothetical protein
MQTELHKRFFAGMTVDDLAPKVDAASSLSTLSG